MILDVLRKKFLENLPDIPVVDTPRPPVQLAPDNVTFPARELPVISAPQVTTDVPNVQLPVITQPNIEGKGQPVITGLPNTPNVELPTIPIPQETQVPTTPNLPVIPPVSESQRIQSEIARRQNKDWKTPVSKGGAGDDDHNWWDVAKGIGLGLLQGGLPGAAIGGIKSGFDPNADEKIFNEQKIGELQQQYERASGIEKDQLAQELAKAKIADIPIDNELRQQQLENQRIAARDRIRSQALGKVFSARYYDPNNLAHRRLAENAGLDPEDLEGWDDRKPTEKQVAGVTYRLNRETGKYEPTNLPTDESKVLTDYQVEMPNGEMRTFKVSQKDAASFATQMKALGARLEATATENQKTREHQVRLKELGSQMQIQLEAIKTANDMAKSAQNAQQKAEHQKRAQDAQERFIQLRTEAQALKNQK